MAYQTYITEAIVCGSWDRNTADKSILLFAREAGMVYVQAKSVRKEHSKQRYALQDASHIRATLIRGKTGWKVAGAEPLQSLYARAETREARALLRDTILLLRRFMHGETAHPDIFDDVLCVLSQGDSFPEKAIKTLLFMRILNTLGYVAPSDSQTHLFTDTFPFEAAKTLTEHNILEFEEIIQNALHQSQL
jgi:recombinational DNA repair protein (RecF pathway)